MSTSYDEMLDAVDELAVRQAAGASQYTYEQQEVDSGPYYLFSAAERKPIHEMRNGINAIEAAQITPVNDWHEWRRIDGEPRGGRYRTGFDHEGEYKEEEYKMYASVIKESILGQLGIFDAWGNEDVKEIGAWAKVPANVLQASKFNMILRPVKIGHGIVTPQLDDDLKATIKAKGGLEARKLLASRGFDYISTGDFRTKLGSDLQSLYLSASDDIMRGFLMAERFGHRLLDSSDAQIRLSQSGSNAAGSKSTYDDRDRLWMWLLAREGIDTALQRALAPQAPGLTGDQLEKILAANQGQSAMTPEVIAAIAAQAAAAAVQAMQGQGAAVPASPERVTDAEEFDRETGGKRKQR